MTTTEVDTLKRTELQREVARRFAGQNPSSWIGRATNDELRDALLTGEVPAKFANGNGHHPDLAVAIAAAINPLLQAQLDEERVNELIAGRLADVMAFVEAKLAERSAVTTFEVQRPDGSRVNVGRTHRQFEELLSWVDAGCYPFLIGPAGSFKTSAAAKVAETLGRPFHMDSMSEGTTPFDLLGFNDATGKAVHTELRRPSYPQRPPLAAGRRVLGWHGAPA